MMKARINIIRIHLVLMFIGSLGMNLIIANTVDSKESIFDLMHYKNVLNITIEADMESLVNQRRSNDYQKGTLTFKDVHKKEQKWKIKVRTRGNFRRMTCAMPPLKLKWKKSDLAAAGLADFNDLKLVTNCTDEKWESRHLLVKEYLAYQLYNELTPNSYRVQFVKITYRDIKTGAKEKQWGFFIEDTAQLVSRTVTEKIDTFGVAAANFHENHVKLVSLFQYMIGNSDWDLGMQRNVKLFKKDGKIIPVAYDFDFSGFVNAPYAIPNPDYGLQSVRERNYQGFEEHLAAMHPMRSYFRTKKTNLQRVIEDCGLLDEQQIAELLGYLESFYYYADELKVRPKEVMVAQKE